MTSLFETLSLTCRCIRLEDLRVDMQIGAYEAEHGRPQPVLVTLEVWVPLPQDGCRDSLQAVYDYSVLEKIVRQTAAQGHIELQETFGDRILEQVLADARVAAARVKTAKLQACCGARAVSVETFRCRKNILP